VFSLFLQDAWKVLLYSLLLGAGLPVVYALGVRASALGTAGAEGSDGADASAGRRHALGKTLAGLCFLVVLVGIGVGLASVVAAGHGEQLSFNHVYPTFVPKS
jgi:hypothetical protein